MRLNESVIRLVTFLVAFKLVVGPVDQTLLAGLPMLNFLTIVLDTLVGVYVF